MKKQFTKGVVMRFYNITVDIKNNPFQQGDMKRNQEKELMDKICRNTMNYIGKKYEKVGVVFFSAVSTPCLNACVGEKAVNA